MQAVALMEGNVPLLNLALKTLVLFLLRLSTSSLPHPSYSREQSNLGLHRQMAALLQGHLRLTMGAQRGLLQGLLLSLSVANRIQGSTKFEASFSLTSCFSCISLSPNLLQHTQRHRHKHTNTHRQPLHTSLFISQAGNRKASINQSLMHFTQMSHG